MKKAVVIGGSSGIGLAISKILIQRGYYLIICSRSKPAEDLLDLKSYKHYYCDLRYFDEVLMKALAEDPEVNVLMITAGVGRVADFSAHHLAEIDNIMKVNTISVLKIISLFYKRIRAEESFYTGVMGSISGRMTTPGASVYAASKASITRFIESVNIELEVAGTNNRILDVSPASFSGSKFYGGKNDIPSLMPLAEDIIKHLLDKNAIFIPQYEEMMKAVLERYHNDAHEYGLYSYQYKRNSNRFDNRKKVIIGYLSGTFDLFHVGHLNLIFRAKQQCDYLIVGVHDSGKWKGKETFIPFEERMQIVGACKYVDKVVQACREDSDAWNLWHYDKLFVGSDYKGTERFKHYEEFFQDKGVEIVYFPYTQSTSSTQIRKTVMIKTKDIKLD